MNILVLEDKVVIDGKDYSLIENHLRLARLHNEVLTDEIKRLKQKIKELEDQKSITKKIKDFFLCQ